MTERRPNYVGIVAGAIVLFVWGAIWFTVLGGAWLASVGKTKEELSASGFWPFIISFVAGLLVSYCFDNMLWHYERADAAKGAQVGILTGVCIFGAMLANLYSFEARPLQLMLIDGGYGIAGFAITGAVVGILRGRATRRAGATA
ncbi:MAG: hypothetical protein JWM87_2234 [Candidatus Eremiobacteraeota bacterium]|nr:hypothetical protein [Candidatus Eremiobacteraeota bacterium]